MFDPNLIQNDFIFFSTERVLINDVGSDLEHRSISLMGTTAPPHGLMGTSDFFYFFILKEKWAPGLQLQARDPLQSALLDRRHHPRIRSFLGTEETFSGNLSFKKRHS